MNNADFVTITSLNLTPKEAVLRPGDPWVSPANIAVEFEVAINPELSEFLPDQARLLIVHAQTNDVYGITPAHLVAGTTNRFATSINSSNPSEMRIYGSMLAVAPQCRKPLSLLILNGGVFKSPRQIASPLN